MLRLLRGEGLDALARESGQAAGTISAWREEFLAAGREGLKSRPRPVEDRALAERRRRARQLRARGLTQQQIAGRLGASRSTISNDLRSPATPPAAPAPPRAEPRRVPPPRLACAPRCASCRGRPPHRSSAVGSDRVEPGPAPS